MKKRSSVLGRLVGFGGVAAVLALLTGCHKAEAPAAPPPPTVGVVESRRMDVPLVVHPNGTTRALELVTIRARVRGFLTERHFEEGVYVKKGDLLLVIDEEPYKIALETAQARQAEAEAGQRKAELSKGREIAQAQLELSRAQLVLAQIQERRNRALLARKAGSAEELDKSEAERRRWEAQVEADRANVDQANADYAVGVSAAKAQVSGAVAAVRDAQLNLGYCRMYSPINGRIGEARVKVGNLVGPDAMGGGAFSELATIHQLDPIGVDIRLSSKDLDRTRDLMKTGLAVHLSRPGQTGDVEHPETGTCYFVDNSVDELTSTFLAKARMPNPGGILLPGEYVKVKMVVGRLDDTVVVPAPAVTESETGPVVYVVDEQGKVAIRPVEAGPTHEGLRVVSRGLDAGVQVIVEGLQSIRPGLAVKTEPSSIANRYAAAGVKPRPEPASARAHVASAESNAKS